MNGEFNGETDLNGTVIFFVQFSEEVAAASNDALVC